MNPLFAVRELLRKREMATASQIAAELRLSTGLVEDMLAYWQHRGVVKQIFAAAARGGCASACDTGSCHRCVPATAASVQAYRWCGHPESAAATPIPTHVLHFRHPRHGVTH